LVICVSCLQGWIHLSTLSSFAGPLHIDTFKEVLSMSEKTKQYEDRLSEFMSYRKKHYSDTYWLS
jgi:hypothetical protein